MPTHSSQDVDRCRFHTPPRCIPTHSETTVSEPQQYDSRSMECPVRPTWLHLLLLLDHMVTIWWMAVRADNGVTKGNKWDVIISYTNVHRQLTTIKGDCWGWGKSAPYWRLLIITVRSPCGILNSVNSKAHLQRRSSGAASTRASLRSAESMTVAVPCTLSSFGDRSFATARPHAWNKLPSHLHLMQSADTFRRHIKTFFYFTRLFYHDIVRRTSCAPALTSP